MKKFYITILLFLLDALLASASLYRTYQTEHGLSHNSVWAVMQDSRGFVWFGTNDGLNRFDGVSFKVFRRKDGDELSLGNNFIHCLLEERGGHILVGTKEGLYDYNPDNDTFSHVSLDGKPVAEDKISIHCLFQDKDGMIWVGCFGQGIYCLSPDCKVAKYYPGEKLPSRFVTAMTYDLAGDIWVGTDGAGLFKLNPATGRVTPSAISAGTVQAVYCDKNNTLWVGTSTDGLFHYEFLSGALSRIDKVLPEKTSVNNIKSIIPFSTNELVLSSEDGLMRLDCISGVLTSFNNGISYDNLPDNSIFALAKDSEGGLWIGTYFYGVSYWSPQVNSFAYYPAVRGSGVDGNNIVKRMAQDKDGNIWLSTSNGGLARFNPATSLTAAVSVPGLSGNIEELLVCGDELWVNDYNRGLAVVDPRRTAITRYYTIADGLPSNIVSSMCRSSKGYVYIGTAKGGCRFADGHIESLPELRGASIMRIIEDYEGNVWFATHFHGLFRLSPDGKYTNFAHSDADSRSLPGNNLNNIFQDTRGYIWVGTEGEGLAMFNPRAGKVERRFTESEGLPSNIIYSVQEDAYGNVWATTGSGLICLNVPDYTVRSFRYMENLLGLHYIHNSGLRGVDNTMYFGGSNGFIAFNPGDIHVNESEPKLLFADLYVNSARMLPGAPGSVLTRPLGSTRDIELSAAQNTFSLDVACLSYLSPDHTGIFYKLDGFDFDWISLPEGRRRIHYMNIPAGNYRLMVKGANNDGVWGQPVEMAITVHPPFMLSKPMLVVYVIALILTFLIAKRVYRRRLEAANQEKMLKFSLAKEKEVYEAKIGFFTNIAHEIRTPLSLISAPLETILSSGDGNERTRGYLSVMHSNVHRLLELVNQLLDFRKVESQLMRLSFSRCDVSAIVLGICRRYEEFTRLHKITLDDSGVAPGVECVLDRDAFQKMVGNLMSNAIKYADRRISVSLRTEGNPARLTLEVADDGPGIKEKDLERIFESFYRVDDHGKHPGSGLGLPLARSLAQMHGGDIRVESEYGHGSVFFLTLPMNIEPDAEEEKAEEDAAEAHVEETASNESSDLCTVLIVEDNDELRNFIVDNLGDKYQVLEAGNGIEALAMIEDSNIDIIVSDIMMPEMDGLELCRAVKSNENYSHLPMILLSAKTDVETKVDGLNIGADAYLEKPFSIEQLRAQIGSIIENRMRLRENFIKSPLDYYKKPHTEDKQEKENAEFVGKLNQLILDNLTNEEFNIDSLARMFYMGRSNFHKRVKAITGKTPNEYIRIVRLSKSAELLATGEYQIVEVCYMVGFNTPSYFSKCFFEHFHQLPKDYINSLNR